MQLHIIVIILWWRACFRCPYFVFPTFQFASPMFVFDLNIYDYKLKAQKWLFGGTYLARATSTLMIIIKSLLLHGGRIQHWSGLSKVRCFFFCLRAFHAPTAWRKGKRAAHVLFWMNWVFCRKKMFECLSVRTYDTSSICKAFSCFPSNWLLWNHPFTPLLNLADGHWIYFFSRPFLCECIHDSPVKVRKEHCNRFTKTTFPEMNELRGIAREDKTKTFNEIT